MATRRKVGNVVAIALGDGAVAYGRLLPEPLIEFYDALGQDGTQPPANLADIPVAFRILVANAPVTSGGWPTIAQLQPSDRPWPSVAFWKKDPISGAISIYELGVGGEPTSRPVSEEDNLEDLERYAVWSRNHVEDRLRDHFAGRPNKWLESLRR